MLIQIKMLITLNYKQNIHVGYECVYPSYECVYYDYYRDVKQTVVVCLSFYLPSGSDTSTLASASGPAGI